MSSPSYPSPGPRLRRKAPTHDSLQETTALQRLVEYFAVITAVPRWTRQQDDEFRQAPRSRERGTPIDESRQGSNGSSGGTDGNIHMPKTAAEYAFQPHISARYPSTDHKDNPFNPMILHFCFPGGDTIVPSQTYYIPQVHHFVLTNDKGRKVYGTCLTVFEEYEPEGPWMRRTLPVAGDDGIELQVDDRALSLYLPKKLCLLSSWPYLSAFREYLAQLYRLATATNVMRVPIERYIVNICSEIPAPPPGAYEVQVTILDSLIRFWAPPAKLPIAYVALPYKILFECLDVDNILAVWTAMIVERKILLVSTHYSILTVCAEILSSLLFPMRWSHLYIPLLPKMFAPMLDAPVPFLCGVIRDSWLYTQKYISGDTIVVDLDNNKLQYGEDFLAIPPLPVRKFMKLRESLLELVGNDFWKAHGAEEYYESVKHKQARKGTTEQLRRSTTGSSLWNEKRANLDNAYSPVYTPDSPDRLNDAMNEVEQEKWASVQEAFHQFFVRVLKGYRKFLFIEEGCCPTFDHESFVAHQKPMNIPFMSEMCMSQQFDDFITRRLYSPGEPDLVFFDQSIDAKKNRSKLKIRKIDTPFLKSASAHKDLTKVSAVPPNDKDLGRKQYVYPVWPATFDDTNFSTPRGIPKSITAEFDRQAFLVSKLRTNVTDLDPERIASSFGGENSESPEVATFTLFFFTYCALVGKDLQRFLLEWSLEPGFESQRLNRGREGVDSTPWRKEAETIEIGQSLTEVLVSDLTFGVCDNCSRSRIVSTLEYLGMYGLDDFRWMFMDDGVLDASEELAMARERSLTGEAKDKAKVTQFEEAHEMASAQLDLAFQTLATQSLRGLTGESECYSSLMEACGRCGDTMRAVKLIELMRNDGFVVDAEILSNFVAAFAHGRRDLSSIGVEQHPSREASEPDVYSTFLRDKTNNLKDQPNSYALELAVDDDKSDSGTSRSSQSSGSIVDNGNGSAALMEFLSKYNHLQPKKKTKRKNKSRGSEYEMPVTEMVARQLDLGETILDLIYPDLKIDTDSDSCPHCSHVLKEKEVVRGWTPSAFQDLKTTCPQCKYRFVAQFSVSTSAPTFEGSQGPGTPLYCEFLSPWVLRRELLGVVKGAIGIDGMLSQEWRNSTDLSATLFWNLILLFRMHRLPFAFLLQGNFDNVMILPRAPEDMS